MIKAPKLYLKRKDIPIESLYDMLEESGEEQAAGVYRKGISENDPKTRSTTLKKINRNDYPEVNSILENMTNIWDGTLNPKDYYVGEYNYLKYGKGDHFTKHIDHIKTGDNSSGRIFSTSTIIKMSDDLKGGDFVIWDNINAPHQISLEVGETIFFSSTTPHQINPVIQGEREVLVAWIYKKLDNV